MNASPAQAPVAEFDVRDTVEYLAGLRTRELVRQKERYERLGRPPLPAEARRLALIIAVLGERNEASR